MKKRVRITIVALLVALISLSLLFLYFGKAKKHKKPETTNVTTTSEPATQVDTLLEAISISRSISRPFGIAFPRTGTEYIEDLGAQTVRFIIPWGKIEPSKGDYDLESLDGVLKDYSSNKSLDLMLTLTAENPWGGYLEDPPNDTHLYKGGYPSDIEAWKKTVTYVVDKFDGDGKNDLENLGKPVKLWQVENEWLWQWVDTPERYVEFLKLTSETIKREDPEAIIVAAALTGVDSMAFAEGYIQDRERIIYTNKNKTLKKNQILNSSEYKDAKNKVDTLFRDGKDYFDVIDIHLYTTDQYVIPGSVKWTVDTATKFGAPTVIWELEGSTPKINYSSRSHAQQVVQQYMLALSSGMDRLYMWTLFPVDTAGKKVNLLALVSKDGQKKPAYYTYKLMVSKLEDMNEIEQFKTHENIFAYKMSNDSKNIFVAWVRNGKQTVSIPFEGDVMITHIISEVGETSPETDIVKNSNGKVKITLTESPIFIEAQP